MMNKLLDLRFMIGLFFSIIGLLLVGYSFLAAYTDPATQHLNRWSGVVFVLFGVFMLYLHQVAERKQGPKSLEKGHSLKHTK